MDTLEELGKKGYQKQIWGDFLGAVQIYTTAINRYPNDPRLLNNRCCCYIELKDYKKAMEDADRMIQRFPQYTKSYYRKGEVLSASKRYTEAVELFMRVLTLDPQCEDARQQLLEVQALQLNQRGYSKQEAFKALSHSLNSRSSIADMEVAEKILKYGHIGNSSHDIDTEGVYYSDDENSSSNIIKHTHNDPLMDPSNPLKSCSLWVGNVTDAVSEKTLKEMFSKYGRIISVCVYYSNFCAFINYGDATAPGKAMKALQGAVLGGKNILIKYPDSAANQNIKRTKP